MYSAAAFQKSKITSFLTVLKRFWTKGNLVKSLSHIVKINAFYEVFDAWLILLDSYRPTWDPLCRLLMDPAGLWCLPRVRGSEGHPAAADDLASEKGTFSQKGPFPHDYRPPPPR